MGISICDEQMLSHLPRSDMLHQRSDLERPMSIGYCERSSLALRLESGPENFTRSGILIVSVMAAVPAVLGLIQELRFDIAAHIAGTGGENAAAAAQASGNQPFEPALGDGVGAFSAAKGDILAICSGASSAIVNAPPNCSLFAAAIQR